MSALSEVPAEWWLWIGLGVLVFVLLALFGKAHLQSRKSPASTPASADDPWNYT